VTGRNGLHSGTPTTRPICSALGVEKILRCWKVRGRPSACKKNPRLLGRAVPLRAQFRTIPKHQHDGIRRTNIYLYMNNEHLIPQPVNVRPGRLVVAILAILRFTYHSSCSRQNLSAPKTLRRIFSGAATIHAGCDEDLREVV
jgi:hypothetical protein